MSKRGERRKEESEEPVPTPPAPQGARWRLFPSVTQELSELPDVAVAGLSTLMERHLAGQTRAGNHFKPIGDGLFELRYEHSNNHFRVIFMRHAGALVGLTAFAKNQEKIPKPDLKRAKSRAEIWRSSHPVGKKRDSNPRTAK